jgi:hypothetical protein
MTKTLTTITGSEIRVTPNHSARTFTIRTSGGKYRTIKLNKDEFRSSLNMTGNDWNQFLKGGDYYRVN